jgi:N-acetylneuraminic acid mutarotase
MKSLTLIALIMVFGSCSDPDSMTEKPAAFPVVDLGDFPGETRIRSSGFSIKDKGYIYGGRDGWIGGSNNSTKYFHELWEYTPDANKWVRKADHPELVSFPPTIIDDTAYFFDYGMSLWTFDAETDIWTKKTGFPGTHRIGFVTMSLAGTLYVGLGWDPVIYSFFNDWWGYDPSTNSWHQKSNVPFEGRYLSFCWSISNRGYLAFGYAESAITFDDFWEYDPAKDSWIERNAKGLGGSMFPDKEEYVLTIGGKPTVLLEGKPDTLQVYQYDFEKGVWTIEYEWANKFGGGMATFSIRTSHYFVFGQNITGTTPGSSNKVWVLND